MNLSLAVKLKSKVHKLSNKKYSKGMLNLIDFVKIEID